MARIKIQPGQTLSGIAQDRGLTIEELQGFNPNITDPDFIRAGDFLNIPDATETATPTINNTTDPSEVDASTLANISSPIQIPTDTGEVVDDPFSRLTDITSNIEELQAQQEKLLEQRRTTTEGQESIQEVRGDEEERLGLPGFLSQINPLIQEQATIRKALVSLGEREQAALDREEDALRPIGLIQGRQAAIKRQFQRDRAGLSAQLGALAATQNALQGNINLARNIANDTVEAIIFDRKQELSEFDFFIEQNQEALDELDEDQKEEILSIRNGIEENLNQLRDEKNEVARLALANPQARINIASDSLEDARIKAQEFLAQEPVTPERTQVVEVAGRKQLIDLSTGKIIKDLGAVGGGLDGAIIGSDIGGPEQQTAVLRNRIQSLPVGQQDKAFSATSTFQNASDLIDLLDQGVKTGPIAGRVAGGVKGPFGLTIFPGKQQLGISSQAQNDFIAKSTVFTANFIKAISGVQVSDKERQFLEKALPSITNQERVNRSNISALLDLLKSKYELQLGLKFDSFPDVIPDPFREVVPEDTDKSYIQGLNLSESNG
jgi:hypothetical protein